MPFQTICRCFNAEVANIAWLRSQVQKSASHYSEAAKDEITLLTEIKDGDPDNSRHCVRLFDWFEHTGPHGRHMCMVFEVRCCAGCLLPTSSSIPSMAFEFKLEVHHVSCPTSSCVHRAEVLVFTKVLGDNLLSLIKAYNYRGIPLQLVKHITRQVLIGLDYIHRKLQIIHTDLKPENVMLTEAIEPRKWLQPLEPSGTPALANRQPPAGASFHRCIICFVCSMDALQMLLQRYFVILSNHGVMLSYHLSPVPKHSRE
jgi:serine/threonine-protein kinase SRPK3